MTHIVQGEISCSILPSGMGGNVEFEWKFEEIWGNWRGNNSK